MTWLEKNPYYPWIFLILPLILIYGQTLGFEFTNWDDDEYVTQNLLIQSLHAENLKTMFSDFYYLMYIPFTLLSYALEYKLAGESGALFHFTNLLLHTANTLLVFVLARQILKQTSWAWLAALLFGIHPLRVESVAWVSERKDVLYTFFLLLSLIQWQKYILQKSNLSLAFSLLFFVFSGLSKATAVLLVPYIILLDYVSGRKWSAKLLLEKIPFIVVALLIGWLQLKGIQGAVESQKDATGYSGIEHFFILGYSYIFYFLKTILPFPLSAYYPLPDKVTTGLHMGYYLAPLCIIGILYGLYVCWRNNKTFWVFGMLWFSAGVFLFLKLRPGGFFIAGDRYTYSASIGLCIALAGIMKQTDIRKSEILYKISLGFAVICMLLSFRQAGIWKNSITLFQDIISKNPDFYMAYVNLGTAFEKKQKYTEALESYRKAIQLNPAFDQPWYNTGNVYLALNQPEQSIVPLQRAVQVNPRFTKAWNNLGSAYFKINRFDSAAVCYRKALELEPDYPSAISNLGQALLKAGQVEEGFRYLNKGLSLQPADPVLRMQVGEAAERLGQDSLAEACYRAVLKSHPQIPESYMAMAGLQLKRGNVSSALEWCDETLKRFPQYGPGWFNKGVIYYQQGDKAEAGRLFAEAARFGHPQAIALMKQGGLP